MMMAYKEALETVLKELKALEKASKELKEQERHLVVLPLNPRAKEMMEEAVMAVLETVAKAEMDPGKAQKN
jgi:hypothetical protein